MHRLCMHASGSCTILIASAEPALFLSIQRHLAGSGVVADWVSSTDAVLETLQGPVPPDILILDATLPDMESGRALAAVRAQATALPIIVVAEWLTETWLARLHADIVDDLVLHSSGVAYWIHRIEQAMRGRDISRELETLREAAARDAQHDRLTGVLNRDAILTALFRETDRIQRAGGALAFMLFDIDDFGHWNSRLGLAECDGLLCQISMRTTRLLRSYDLIGRMGNDEFLLGLPGCSASNAMMLAERLRNEVLGEPFHVGGEVVRISASFGLAMSQGRSPLVVLCEAEEALLTARQAGPESIRFGGGAGPQPPPVTFVSPTSGEELLAW